MEISRHVATGVIRDEVQLPSSFVSPCPPPHPDPLTSLFTQDVDERVRDYLAAQPPRISSKAINEFCAKDMTRINNKSSFLKGIVRKILESEAELAGTRAPLY
jgi:hypothetical protein